MIWTIAKKELRGYFGSAVALIFLGAFLAGALYTFFWHEKFFARGIADLRPLFEWMPILLAFLIAALSMRLWAEERNTGTLEVLLTLPVARWKLVAGKFVGGMLLIAIALALTLGIPLTVAQMGDLDTGPVIGGYLAALLLSAAYLVVGMCISAATHNQIVAVVGTAVTFGVLTGVGQLGELGRLFGTSSRFESVARGVLDLRDLAYYAGIVVLGFAINVLLIGSVSWGEAPRARERRFQTVLAVGLIAVNAIALVVWLAPVRAARVDLTQDGAYSLSGATRDILRGLDERVLIRAYLSEKTHPQLEPLIPQLRDLLEEYRAAGGDRVKVEIVDPTEDDDAKRDAKERFDITPQPMAFATASERSVVNAYFAVAIQYGDQHEVLGLFDLIQVRQLDLDKVEISLRNVEYQITKSVKKTVQSFSSLDTLFASTPGKIKLTAYVTPDTLPDNLKDAPAKLAKVTEELIKESKGKLEVTQVAPKTEAEMIDLYRKYGIRPFTDLASGKTYYFQLLLEISDRLVRIQPPDTLGEAAIKSAVLDGLKRGAPGFTRVVGLWAPRPPMIPPEMMQPGMPPPRMPPPQSFAKLKEELTGDYEVRDLLLDRRVPEDIDVLILAGPAGLDDTAAKHVEQFAMRGGSLIVLNGRFRLAPAEGVAIERVTTGLEKLFEGWGITVGDQLVLDTRSDTFPIPRNRDLGNGMIVREVEQLPYPYFVKVAGSQIESSLITAGIPGSVMHFASPVTVKEKENRVVVEPLLVSSDESWLSSSLSIEPDPARGFPGPTDGKRDSHPLAVAVTFTSDDNATKATLDDKLPADARIAMFGSSVFVSDTLLEHAARFDQDLALSNLTLVHNAVDWAFADTDLLGIRSQALGSHSLTIDPEETAKWQLINVGLAMVGLAVVVVIPLVRRRSVRPVVNKEAA